MIPSTMELYSMRGSESRCSHFKKTMSLLHIAEIKVSLKEVQVSQIKSGNLASMMQERMKGSMTEASASKLYYGCKPKPLM